MIGHRSTSRELFTNITTLLHTTGNNVHTVKFLLPKSTVSNVSRNRIDWWVRERVTDYLPIFTADHQPLIDYLKRQKIIGKKERGSTNKVLVEVLDILWSLLHFAEPHIVIWGLLITAILISRFY